VLVVAILGLLAALAVPRLGATLANRRAEWAAKRIVADFALARTQARATSQPVTVSFDPAADAYRIVNVPNPVRPAQEYVVNLSGEPYNVEIASADFGGDGVVTFDEYGLPDSGGDVYLRAGDWLRRIVLDADSGLASVE